MSNPYDHNFDPDKFPDDFQWNESNTDDDDDDSTIHIHSIFTPLGNHNMKPDLIIQTLNKGHAFIGLLKAWIEGNHNKPMPIEDTIRMVHTFDSIISTISTIYAPTQLVGGLSPTKKSPSKKSPATKESNEMAALRQERDTYLKAIDQLLDQMNEMKKKQDPPATEDKL